MTNQDLFDKLKKKLVGFNIEARPQLLTVQIKIDREDSQPLAWVEKRKGKLILEFHSLNYRQSEGLQNAEFVFDDSSHGLKELIEKIDWCWQMGSKTPKKQS